MGCGKENPGEGKPAMSLEFRDTVRWNQIFFWLYLSSVLSYMSAEVLF